MSVLKINHLFIWFGGFLSDLSIEKKYENELVRLGQQVLSCFFVLDLKNKFLLMQTTVIFFPVFFKSVLVFLSNLAIITPAWRLDWMRNSWAYHPPMPPRGTWRRGTALITKNVLPTGRISVVIKARQAAELDPLLLFKI